MTETVLLLSGGLDSTALACWIEPDQAVTIDYGQTSAEAEIEAATQICEVLSLSHDTIEADCSDLGTGSMSEAEQIAASSTPEWWPFRNQLVITLSAMRAVALEADQLIVGSVQSDRRHADGKPEFFELMDELLSLQEGGIRVSAPAIDLTSTQLVEKSGAPLSLLGWTHSCHTSNNACGECRGCSKKSDVLSSLFEE